jgi:aryl-alcohol dehydrogenase-like predicted oxidoreductase
VVSESQPREALQLTPVVSVQNRYNLADRSSEPVVDICDQEMLVSLPWAPIQDADWMPAVLAAASHRGVSPRQIAIAWLLARSPHILPIPGSGTPSM